MVEMNRDDIERSPIVSKILEIFNYKPTQNISDTENVTLNDTVRVINNDAALIPLSDKSKYF
jgi:hypothetical protein